MSVGPSTVTLSYFRRSRSPVHSYSSFTGSVHDPTEGSIPSEVHASYFLCLSWEDLPLADTGRGSHCDSTRDLKRLGEKRKYFVPQPDLLKKGRDFYDRFFRLLPVRTSGAGDPTHPDSETPRWSPGPVPPGARRSWVQDPARSFSGQTSGSQEGRGKGGRPREDVGLLPDYGGDLG